jgi:ABC-2 type transport system permease protein
MAGASRIGAIVRKDFTAFTRDRFYFFMTILGLVAYVAIYWFLPNTVDETIEIGVHGAGFEAFLGDTTEVEGQGMRVVAFDSPEAVESAVAGEGDVTVAMGLSFPDDFLEAATEGRVTTVSVYVTGDLPPQLRATMTGMVREIAFAVAGSDLPVTLLAEEEVILGEDRAGNQVSLQQNMGPLLIFFMLMVETFALAGLIASEIQSRTVTAVLITPVRMSEFLAAKSIFGTLLAFSQAALLALLIGMLGASTGALLITLLLGALLVTGLGLVAGSSGKDFMGILFWSMLIMIPLMIPAIAALFPGTAASWVAILPSYGLVEAIVRTTAYGDTFVDILPYLAMLAAWCLVAFGAGLFTLRRKVATL